MFERFIDRIKSKQTLEIFTMLAIGVYVLAGIVLVMLVAISLLYW